MTCKLWKKFEIQTFTNRMTAGLMTPVYSHLISLDGGINYR